MAGLRIERPLWSAGHDFIAGADEAGRGCLAGPVVAAAVMFRPGHRLRGITDSKLLTPEQRTVLASRIRSRAIAVGVGICSPAEVDDLNVLWASMEAMRRAVRQLRPVPTYVLVDGNQVIPDSEWPVRPVVGGDLKSQSIAAASIIAKVERDRIMHRYHESYPAYEWSTNVGYPTRAHYRALTQFGPTPLHRNSFNLVDPYPPDEAETRDSVQETVHSSAPLSARAEM